MGVVKRKRQSKGKSIIFYQAEVYWNGAVVERQSFNNSYDARLWHDKMRQQYSSGCAQTKKSLQDYVIKDLVAEFIEAEYPARRKSSNQSDHVRWPYILESPIADIPVKDITARHIDLWFNYLHLHETVASTKRISFRKEWKLLKLILNWYRENKDAAFIPQILKRHAKRCEIAGKARPKRHDEMYMDEQSVKLWIASLEERKDPVYCHLGVLMVLTGFRVGEACGLSWEDIDLQNRTISIRNTMSWDQKTKRPYLQQGQAKNSNSLRTIAMPSQLYKLLAELKLKSRSGFVFRNAKGEPLHYNSIRNNFNRAFKKAGLSYSGTHICRHSFATLSLKATNNPAATQNVLGHASAKQTEHYAKNAVFNGNDAPERTSELIGDLFQSGRVVK